MLRKNSLEKIDGFKNGKSISLESIYSLDLDVLNQLKSLNMQSDENEIRIKEKKLQGTYGICDLCGRKIDKNRLQIIPNSCYCIVCKKVMEQKNH